MRRLIARVAGAEEIQHHGAGPDSGYWVGDVLAINIRRRAVYRLEQRREGALRIQVRRRGDADSAGTGRAKIGEDIAEQI